MLRMQRDRTNCGAADLMGLFKDEKKHGREAREVAARKGDGGSAKEIRKRGTVYDHTHVKSASLRNLMDSIETFRKGK